MIIKTSEQAADEGSIEKKLISEEVTPICFIREELWTHDSSDEPTEMRSAYSFAGDYIGPASEAEKFSEFGIVYFERREPDSTVASIGFNPATEKWFGWSHRAIYGYGVGDVVESGTVPVNDFENDGECYYDVKPGMRIETLDDAKRVAKAFARAVS